MWSRAIAICLLVILPVGLVPLAGGQSLANGSAGNLAATDGLDLDGMDTEVLPGHDFYSFANGAWARRAVIAPGDWQTGTLKSVKDRTDADAEAVVRMLRRGNWPEGSDEAKFLSIYQSALDRTSRRLLGVRPVNGFVRQIKQAETHQDIALLMGSHALDAGGLFESGLRIDPLTGQGYVIALDVSSFLLGSRDLHLRTDAPAVAQRAEATRLLARLLRRTGTYRRVNDRVTAVLAVERALADVAPDVAVRRVPIRPEQVFSLEQLQARFPDFHWGSYFAARGLGGTSQIHVQSLEALPELIAIFHATGIDVWKDYLILRLMTRFGPYLDPVTEGVALQLDAVLKGADYARPSRRERARQIATSLMPDVVGRHYISAHVDDAAIEDVERMTAHLKAAFRKRLLAADGLAADTRATALEKLDRLQLVVGAPPGWNDYDGYAPDRRSLFGNVYLRRQLRHESSRLRLLSQAAGVEAGNERSDEVLGDVFFSPLSVGAFYLPSLNTIVVPAAYLQAPYYDANASLAVNFGMLGTTLGHEIGHAFDDQGSKRGPSGRLRNWWTVEDRDWFDGVGAALSDQLSAFEAAPGVPLNTRLTLGENLSDVVGVDLAFDALERAADAAGRNLTVEDRQAFFVGYAQKRRSKRTDAVIWEFATTDPHSPPEVRVNGILAHIDAWYEAFGVTAGDALWLAPEERVRVW